MSTTTDRIELRDPDGYKRKLKEYLGGRDPLEALAETPDLLRAAVGGTPADVLRSRPFEGKWTPLEIVGHMLDVEWVFGYRTRAIACDDKPRIVGMDQDDWVDGQRHNEREPSELVEPFAAMREMNLRFWHRLTPEQRRRVGKHDERGEESIETMLTMIAGHDGWHLDQIDRYIAAAEK